MVLGVAGKRSTVCGFEGDDDDGDKEAGRAGEESLERRRERRRDGSGRSRALRAKARPDGNEDGERYSREVQGVGFGEF